MTEHSDHRVDELSIEDRLRRLGGQPVDPSLASQHLTAMADVAPARAPFGRRLRVGAALVAGLLVGGTGLASAGALGPAQGVAHSALGRVGISVPDHDRHNGPECTDEDGNPIADLKNHGQYVRSQAKGDRSAAAKSNCGKKVKAVDPAADTESTEAEDGEKTAEEKAQQQAEKDARKAEQEAREKGRSESPPSTVPDQRPADAGPPPASDRPGKAAGHSGETPGNGPGPDVESNGRGPKAGNPPITD